MQTPMKVREMAAVEQPAHRVALVGPAALSTAELLAAVAGPAAALESLHIALSTVGLEAMAGWSPAHIRSALKVSQRAASAIACAFELGRRTAVAPVEKEPMRGPRDIWRYFGPRLEALTVEEFHVAILDAQHRLEKTVLVSRGILNSSLVHPREVFREVVQAKAASIILVHNHPSGDPTPSADDRTITTQLVAAGRLLDIPVHDHIVIGRQRYVSFAEAGIL